MRRVLPYVLLLAVLAALGVGAASSNGEEHSSKRSAPVTRPGHSRDQGPAAFRGHGVARVLAHRVLASGAQRLGVERDELAAAVRKVAARELARHAKAAGLTASDRAALRSCRRAWHRGAGASRCDRKAAKAALRKLKAAPLPDLAAAKDRIAAALAADLGVSQEKLLQAARAELVLRLDQATALGLVSAKGKDLALGCFDTPAACDLEALRAEVKLPFGHGHGRRHG